MFFSVCLVLSVFYFNFASLFFPSPVFSKGLKTYYILKISFWLHTTLSVFILWFALLVNCDNMWKILWNTPQKTPKRRNDGDQNGKLFLCSLYIFRSLHYCRDLFLSSNYFMGLSGQYFSAKYFELRPPCTTTVWKIIVPNFCRNDELSSTLSWVACLLRNRFSATR